VPAGPLAVRWLGYELPPLVAGVGTAARIGLENAGSATWRSSPGGNGVQLSFHWLDSLANPIVWDGPRTALPRPLAPGERAELSVGLVAPMPPGDYRLAFDLVHEHRFWFAEVGSAPLELPATVLPRLRRRSLGVRILGDPRLAAETEAELEAQEEPVTATGEATAYLPAGARPAPDWSRRLLDAHAEGFAAVAGSVELERRRLRRPPRELEPWAPGFGRVPDWTRPLLCPSLLVDIPVDLFAGLPAVDPAAVDGPTLCDGRIRVRLPGGRPRA
jgi:hypothetical protein